jgi:hypothetical protein
MRKLVAKWAGKCVGCGEPFVAGTEIAYRGTRDCWHVRCHEADLEADAARDREDAERSRVWREERKAGLHVTVTATETELVVRGAWDAAMARDAARAFVCSVTAAGGKAWLVKHRRGGKVFLGRELASYYGWNGGGMKSHEGWAFRYRVEAPDADAGLLQPVRGCL